MKNVPIICAARANPLDIPMSPTVERQYAVAGAMMKVFPKPKPSMKQRALTACSLSSVDDGPPTLRMVKWAHEQK